MLHLLRKTETLTSDHFFDLVDVSVYFLDLFDPRHIYVYINILEKIIKGKKVFHLITKVKHWPFIIFSMCEFHKLYLLAHLINLSVKPTYTSTRLGKFSFDLNTYIMKNDERSHVSLAPKNWNTDLWSFRRSCWANINIQLFHFINS